MESLTEIFRKNNGYLKTKDICLSSDWRELRRMLDLNLVIKIKKGLYRLNEKIDMDQRTEIVKIIPEGVFCMFTAWQYYNLSVYIPYEFYVAIRKKQKIVLPAYPPIKLYYWIDNFFLLGITEITVDNQKIKIYDLEKSVCDAVRFRNKIGVEMMSEILKNYIKRKDKNLIKLAEYAEILRIEKTMMEIMTVML